MFKTGLFVIKLCELISSFVSGLVIIILDITGSIILFSLGKISSL